MTDSQKIELRISAVQQRLREIAQLEGTAYSEEIRAENLGLQAEFGQLEERKRASLIAEGAAETRAQELHQPDAEHRERLELRSKARLTNYLLSAAKGQMISGVEAELSAAAGVGGIPLELWEVRQPETRAVTESPGTVGINLDTIRPAVFANSIAPKLGIEMPMVPSGTYASATISQSQTAEAKDKGADAAATAGTFRVATASPKRISARLELTLEDIAQVGQENFESVLRQNTSLVLSDELDKQAINGNGTSPNLAGIFQGLTTPTAMLTDVADFDAFVAQFANGIDGLWAEDTKSVAIVAGVDAYKLSAKTFRDATADLGSMAFSDYAREHFGGWWTNKRMPAAVSTVQQAILYRMGRSMQGGAGAMRTAVIPYWNEVSIDDIYSGSASGTRSFTLHVLIGDVIIVQDDAYAQVQFKVA